jgi:hypothetical protein
MNDSLQERVDAGLRAAFADEQETEQRAGIVVDWTLTCEIVGNDGEMWLHTLRSHGIAAWKALGMIESHAVDLRTALQTKGGGDD